MSFVSMSATPKNGLCIFDVDPINVTWTNVWYQVRPLGTATCALELVSTPVSRPQAYPKSRR